MHVDVAYVRTGTRRSMYKHVGLWEGGSRFCCEWGIGVYWIYYW
jgi:hypothetical protein